MAVVINVYGKVELSQIEKAEKPLARMKREVAPNQGHWSTLGSVVSLTGAKIASGLAAAGVTKWLMGSVSAAQESETAQMRLMKAVEATGGVWGKLQPAIDVVTCGAHLGTEHVADLALTDGSVTADGRRATMRTATLEIAPDGSFTHEEMYRFLSTPGLELRPRRGVQYADGVQETSALGCFVIDELSYAETASGTQLSAQCSDVSVRIQRAALTDPYQMTAGDSLAEVVIAALADRYAQVSVGFTASTVPDELAASVVLGLGSSSNPWSELQTVMESHGWLLYLDADGVVQATVPIDPSFATPAYVYKRGAAALVTERTRSLPLDAAYNGVIVTGEGSGVETPVRGEAWDTDQRSPTYYLGPFGLVPKFISSSLVTTAAQAMAVAALTLSLAKGRRDEFSFVSMVRPELAPLDVVGMESAGGGSDVCVIDQVATPLSPTGTQSAITRSSVAEA